MKSDAEKIGSLQEYMFKNFAVKMCVTKRRYDFVVEFLDSEDKIITRGCDTNIAEAFYKASICFIGLQGDPELEKYRKDINEIFEKPTERKVFMINVNSGGVVFVKSLEFFIEQKGLVQDWGINWYPVVAFDIEDARRKGCLLSGARPYEQQAI